jgi:hypothetical protein
MGFTVTGTDVAARGVAGGDDGTAVGTGGAGRATIGVAPALGACSESMRFAP